MLNEQLQKQIRSEATSSAANFHYCPGSEQFEDMETAYETGAFKYAEKWQQAQQRAERYEKWLAPIIEWGQIQGFPPGTEITNEVLHRAKEYAELKAKVERYEKALKEIEALIEQARNEAVFVDEWAISLVIKKALTPKTGSDETKSTSDR